MNARALSLIENSSSTVVNKASTAKRLKAAIFDGTLGEYCGSYPLPARMQKVVDKKARMLADEAYDLIREGITRQIRNSCFTGRNAEIFHEDEALVITAKTTLDDALTPIARQTLRSIQMNTRLFVMAAERAQNEIDIALRKINLGKD